MTVTDFHGRIEHLMDELADLPARLRRKIALAVSETGDEARARQMAAGAYSPGGSWNIGVNFHAAPAGCQDCAHANWEGEAVTCGWELAPAESKITYPYGNGPSYEQRLDAAVALERNWKHTQPAAFLEYARAKGAVDRDGHIDVDLISRQCSKCEPLEEDDDE